MNIVTKVYMSVSSANDCNYIPLRRNTLSFILCITAVSSICEVLPTSDGFYILDWRTCNIPFNFKNAASGRFTVRIGFHCMSLFSFF